ncbi:MAG: O-antigen ligase family protein [Ignavibacteriaceae bacterium]|nr:O-antigen ligase family protein [Ignavibacteriaceae bacterium]
MIFRNALEKLNFRLEQGDQFPALASSRISGRIIFVLLSIFAVSFVLSLALMQFIGAVIFIIWLTERWREKRKAMDTLTSLIILFGFIRILSIIFSEYPALSNESLYKEALFYSSFVSVNFYLKTLPGKKIHNLFMIFIIGAAVMAAIGSIRFVLGIVDRAQGFSSSYTVFSCYILTAFSAGLYFPRQTKETSRAFLWSFLITLLFIGLVTSLGRANIAIAVLILISALLLRRLNLKEIIFLGLFFSLFAAAYFLKPSQVISERVQNISYLSDRDIIWMGAGQLLNKHPVLGFGPRTFREIFPQELKEMFADKGIGGWHNDFLQVYFESGLLGLASFIILIIYIFYLAILNERNKKISGDLKRISSSALAAIVSMLISSLFSGFIYSVVLSIVFVFLITVITRIHSDKILAESVQEKPQTQPAID